MLISAAKSYYDKLTETDRSRRAKQIEKRNITAKREDSGGFRGEHTNQVYPIVSNKYILYFYLFTVLRENSVYY